MTFNANQNAIMIIPARLASSRLPQKPLHLIAGKPLIIHVLERARQAFHGRILVACCSDAIRNLVEDHNFEAVLTDPNVPSGTDRVYEAYIKALCTERYIINLQGDMAIFPPNLITDTLSVFETMDVDTATALSPMHMDDIISEESTVKVAFEPDISGENQEQGAVMRPIMGRALYFSRAAIPHNAKQFYKHIGVYIYTKDALREFIQAPVSELETIEKLEQLRGLAIGHRYGAAVVGGNYFSVDTLKDAQKVENYLRISI